MLAQHTGEGLLQDGPDHEGLAGRGLKPGRTRDSLRARGEIDFRDGGILQHRGAALEGAQHVVGIVVNEVEVIAGLSAKRFVGIAVLSKGGQNRTDHGRGLAPLRDTDDDIASGHTMIFELELADQLEVLESFQRADQRAIGSGHLPDQPILNIGGQVRLQLLP